MSKDLRSDVSEVIAQNRPDYASLFGSLELCDCPHCRSVYSPAAYLVDLLQYLGPNQKVAETTPLDVLIGNAKKGIKGWRPDIAHLTLSCENTNTTLPYVDLVNEVLESHIAFDQTLPVEANAAGELIPRPNESSPGVTSAELAANPENIRDRAYDVLETAVYPFTLPFNQPITALRLTLEQMGTSRHEVMDVFGPDRNGDSAAARAAGCALDVEALKLTEREFSILTGERFDGTAPIWPEADRGVPKFYGFDVPSEAEDTHWVKDSVPPTAEPKAINDAWVFAPFHTAPESGALPHASRVAAGLHHHYFINTKAPHRLKVEPEDFLYAEIFLDPANLPEQVLLQWEVQMEDGRTSLEHRAYWGQNKINWGVEGTAGRRYVGPLPPAGHWVRLEVPASFVRVGGQELSGMAFTLFGGGATWGAAGKRSASWVETLTHVPTFLARTGVTYVELVDLVRTGYINKAFPRGDALALFERIPFSFRRLADLADQGFPETDVKMLKALDDAKITVDELRDWSAANLEPLSKMIVLDATESACDVTLTWLQHLDGTMLDEADLGRLHRFIRLWRKLGWSMQDLDRALRALQAPDIDRDFLRRLGGIVQLQAMLKLSPQQLVSFCGALPTEGKDALYAKLFLNKAVRDIDTAFEPINGEYLSPARNLKIKDHIPALLAGLRTRAADLALIRAHTSLVDDDAPLTLATATTLYRYVTLARALKIPVSALIDFEMLSDVKPFSKLESNVGFKDIDPARTLAFVRVANRVDQSGFSHATLRYLFGKREDAAQGIAPSDEQIRLVLGTVAEGLIRIAAEHVFIADPTGEVTRAKLSLLFEPHLVEQLAGLVGGAPLPSTVLAALPPDLVLPAGKVSYDSTSGL
jgi:hypothetical protein